MAEKFTVAADDVDLAILAELQADGRLPFTELGRRVNLSASAVTERVRRLTEAGFITGYRAVLDLPKLGFPVLADVRLKYPGSRHQPLHDLLARRPEILECLRVTGDACYVLKVAARDMPHLEQIVNELSDFGSATTSVVYSTVQPYRDPFTRAC
jgi:Lrp/AsnC family leucine-responsive transcriptional regulator